MKKQNEKTAKLIFEIIGNPKDGRIGNPLPKLKMTGKQHWTEKAQNYVAWKSHVLAACIDAAKGTDFEPMVIRTIGIHGKAFDSKLDFPIRMDIMIHWKNNAHADPENVFGSIADALFKQDKYVKGSFDFVHDGRGMVEVSITLLKQ